MKRAKPKHGKRLKAIGITVAGIVVGIGLLILSQIIVPASDASEPNSATAPAPAPGDQPSPDTPPDPNTSPAANMGGLLLLFSMVSFGVSAIGIGWLVFDIHRSRPAWKTQKKYPVKKR